MRKILTAVIASAALSVLSTASHAADSHTPEQAKAFVEKAVDYYKSAGKDTALMAFSDPKGGFVDEDLYLVVMDAADGKFTMLAHGTNKALIGKPQIDIKDAEGRAFMQETASALAKSSATWTDYKWPNPATKKIASKRTYFVKTNDVVIGAGVYN